MQDSLTISEAAQRLGVSRSKIWSLLREGALEAHTNPLDKRQHLIPSDLIARLQKEGRSRSPSNHNTELPRSIGLIQEPSLQSEDFEEMMEQHWRPA